MMHDTFMSGGMHGPLLLVATVVVLAGILLVLVVALRRPAGAGHVVGRFEPSASTLEAHRAEHDGADAVADMVIVIPDISGYTSYMSHSHLSLRHAQYVVGELLSAIATAARPALSICRPEGDALLLYRKLTDGPPEPVTGTLIEMLAAFYQRRDELVAENGCPCQACALVEDLELKVVVHRGEVLETHIAGFHTLAGLPVIAAHRLLKNTVPSHRYVLVTDAAAAMTSGLPDWPVDRHHEVLDDGSPIAVTAYMVDLADLPRAAAANGLERSVKRACDLCRKVAVGLQDR